MTLRCVVLPYETADGPANMALDEAMLEAVIDDPACAYFRTYGWSVATLSLGYFQYLAEADADPRWRSVPKVRRPTGGGALWHDQEVTYALAIPRGSPLARESRVLYRAVHEAAAAVLREAGIDAARRGDVGDFGNRREQPFLCFTGHDAEDIVSHGAKLVGSAQRRRAGAVLQHGALVLRRSPLTPDFRGAADLALQPSDDVHWRNSLEHGIMDSLGCEFVNRPVPLALRERSRILEDSVYRCHAWTARR